MLVLTRFVISVWLLSISTLNVQAQGLLFKSEDSLLTQRTSLQVFHDRAPEFSDSFHIDFDLSLWENANLGYIFNLADRGGGDGNRGGGDGNRGGGDGKDNSYSLSFLFTNGAGNLHFNIDRQSSKLTIPLRADQLKRNNWFHVRIVFDLVGDAITMEIDHKTYRAVKLGFHREMTANLVFGKNPYYTEVPNMAIRNLEVGNENQDFRFPLDEWNGTLVHDSRGRARGAVENPVWLINESYFWKPVYSLAERDVAGLNFNPQQENLFIFTRDSLITYQPVGNWVGAKAYANPLPVDMVLGKSIYSPKTRRCFVYELFDIPKGRPSVAALDLSGDSLRWDVVGRVNLAYQRHHHNIFFDPKEDGMFLFGGYGNYHYHNSFLRYDDTTDQWQPVKFSGDTITPRFFSATGPSDRDGELFLFGGYGNESGQQVVGGRQYYDFYRINLRDHSVKRCWTIAKPDSGVFVPANNLILSRDKKFFYALCYPHEVAKSELRLYKFSVADGSYEVVSAPLPMASMRIETDVNLYYSDKADEFLCTVQEFADRKSSVIKVYSLTGSPVSSGRYLASLAPSGGGKWGWLWIVGGVAAALGVVGWRWAAARARAEVVRGGATAPVGVGVEAGAQRAEVGRNAVWVLGEFGARDRGGRDITHLFSPKIKQLFVLILLHSRDGAGISSRKISAKLWPEKELAKTKNIKGVTVNHLRSILGDIEGIELIFANDCYSFQIGEEFFCDYWQVMDAIQAGSVQNLYGLISRGPLLADLPEGLLDEVKSAYEERLVGLLIPELRRLYESGEYKPALEMAKLILDMDAFNEDAIKYQLKSCRRLKGIDYSRKAYDQFTQDYERSLGVAYHVSFDKIVH